MELDLRDPDAAARLCNEVEKTFGGIDILVNNACVSTTQSFIDIDAAVLDEHYAVNVRAVALLCKEFTVRFKKETGGKIINLTSGQSVSVMKDELPYAITKAALEMLTLQLADELRTKGITINAVDPGPTDTGWITPEMRHIYTATPEEVAESIATFIAGEREGVTGSVLHIQQERT